MNKKFERLMKFCFSAFVCYFVVKVPVIWLLTEYFAVHYILSGAIAGAVLAIANFVPSEWWVFKKKLQGTNHQKYMREYMRKYKNIPESRYGKRGRRPKDFEEN